MKYRVVVREMDSTCDVPLLIWDKECYDFVGVSASSLRQKYAEVRYVVLTKLYVLFYSNLFFLRDLMVGFHLSCNLLVGKPVLFRISMKK